MEVRASLRSMRNAALRRKKKLFEDMKNPNFEKGLSKDVARQLAFDQAAFWDYLSRSPPSAPSDNEDADRDGQRIIAEMAEIEDDLTKPEKMKEAFMLHRRVVDEVKNLAREMGQEKSVEAFKQGIALEGGLE
eukprot:g2007.t1